MAHRKRRNRNSYVRQLPAAIGGIFKRPFVIAWLFVIISLVVLTTMSVPKLRAAHLSPTDIYIEFDSPPPWLSDSLLFELQQIVSESLANAPVGREGLIDATQALSETGWFTDVRQVRWTDDQSAHVTASFLIPYARIKDESEIRFIDSFGRLLPKRHGLIVKENYHFITIANTQFQSPARSGLQWNGDDVLAGLALIQLFYKYEWNKQIETISLARWSEQQYLTFETNSESQFLWGSSPHNERGLEALAAQKLARLQRAHETSGKIDQGFLGNFDLTHTSNFSRK